MIFTTSQIWCFTAGCETEGGVAKIKFSTTHKLMESLVLSLNAGLGSGGQCYKQLAFQLCVGCAARRCAQNPPPLLLGTTTTTMCMRLQCLRVTVRVSISVRSPKQA